MRYTITDYRNDVEAAYTLHKATLITVLEDNSNMHLRLARIDAANTIRAWLIRCAREHYLAGRNPR